MSLIICPFICGPVAALLIQVEELFELVSVQTLRRPVDEAEAEGGGRVDAGSVGLTASDSPRNNAGLDRDKFRLNKNFFLLFHYDYDPINLLLYSGNFLFLFSNMNQNTRLFE